jgi:molybdenum cofactor guanylyltransferase
MTNLLNGLILCGGKSSRMGKDKSLISYHGKPQRDHLIELLKPFCPQVCLSMPAGVKATQSIIPDHFDLNSPLNGILSAFHYDPEAAWLTVPVDMPNITEKTIEFLLKNRDPLKAATCFLDSDEEGPEPLFTVWEAKAKPLLFDFFNHGEKSPRKFLMEYDAKMLPAPQASWLLNVNTPEELAHYLDQSGKTLQRNS